MYTLKARTATTSCERHVDAAPPNFDPQQCPILAVHWFGMHQPARPSAEVVDLNLIRLAAALHGLATANGLDVGTRADFARRLGAPA